MSRESSTTKQSEWKDAKDAKDDNLTSSSILHELKLLSSKVDRLKVTFEE